MSVKAEAVAEQGGDKERWAGSEIEVNETAPLEVTRLGWAFVSWRRAMAGCAAGAPPALLAGSQ
jgi:hypothetical protein